MGKTHVYLKPFIDDAGSAYAAAWTEVTRDVMDMGALSQQLDNTEYDVGVFRSANLKLKLRNDHGLFGNVGTVETMFKYKRGDTLVKITWEPSEGPLICGFFVAGAPSAILSEEVEVFQGLLNDTATSSPIDEQTVEFQVLGYESLLAVMTTPYASITVGDTVELVLETLLNQAPLNARVTVSAANIASGAAATIDAKTAMENKAAIEVLKILLFASSTVLYVRDNVLYAKARTEGATLAFTFYGQGATAGIENILDIDNYRSGEHRILNYLTWKDDTNLSQDASSVALYGIRKKQVDVPYITDNADQDTLLAAIKNEFRNPKREFSLSTPLTPSILALYLLDKVSVDYPSPYVPYEGQLSRPYGMAEYGVDYYATNLYALTIESSARFKIMSRKIDFKGQTATFGVREI